MSDGKLMSLIILKDGRKGCSHTKYVKTSKRAPPMLGLNYIIRTNLPIA